MHGAPVTWLPPELRTGVFDSLVLKDLLTTSWVCRTWRATARAHQTFWKDINLSSSSSAAADFLLARLAASNPAAAISLYIALDDSSTLDPEPARAVIDSISSNIHRLESLTLYPFAFDRDLIPLIWDALRRPAPLLRIFAFKGVCGPCLIPLPRDLFSGNAPKLEILGLKETLLNDTAPVVFTTAQAIIHSFLSCTAVKRAPRSRGHLLMTQFPAAQFLQFKLSNIDAASLPPVPAFDLSQFQVCRPAILNMQDFMEFCRWGPVAQFPIIHIGGVHLDTQATNILLEHLLPEELCLGIDAAQLPDSLQIIITTMDIVQHPDAARKRIFLCRADRESLLALAPVTSGPVLSAITKTVNVPWRALPLVSAWLGGSLPAVQQMIIDVEHDLSESPLAEDYSVSTPALQLLLLRAPAPMQVASDVLEHLITRVLVRPACSLDVTLQNVTIFDGYHARLNDLSGGTIEFESVG